jgi:predicted Zn-dependent protease with MMP-like domain
MEPAEFEQEVGRVLAELPTAVSEQIANVAFGTEDGRENLNLLGLYRGVPVTRRTAGYSFALPDTITIYRLPILMRCTSREEVVHQVEVTVKHEIGHYFGIDDARLHELGWA